MIKESGFILSGVDREDSDAARFEWRSLWKESLKRVTTRGTAVEVEGKAKYKALSLKFPWQVHLTAWGQSGWSKEGGEISRKVGWKSIWGQFWQSLVGHPLLRVWILFWMWGKTIEVSRPGIVGRTGGLKVIWCDWAVKHTLQITKEWVRGAGWRLNMMGFAKKSLAQP